jgi:hypothetical protein
LVPSIFTAIPVSKFMIFNYSYHVIPEKSHLVRNREL